MSHPHSARRRTAALVGALALFATVCGAGLLLRRGRPMAPAGLDRALDSELEYTLDSLDNGVRYYVRAHPGSGDRTELRLVVDAGAVHEAEDQRGLAHAVEHMVFRGTRSFPRGAVERWFEAIGMRRGSDVNATTALDETQYRMTVPTDRAGAIDTALAMLASMAHEATFDPDDAQREAGVLLEEWRSSRDADARVAEARHPHVYAGTAYAARPVLGDTGVLGRFDRAAMRRFYETWYRPEFMAVVVVGDFDPDSVEALVRARFGPVPTRGARRGRPIPPEPPAARPPTRVVMAPDDEARSSWIAVWHPEARQRYRTRRDYRTSLVAWLWRDVLRGRLEDATLEADAPLAGSGVESRTLARRLGADVVTVTAMKGRTIDALEATVAEVKALADGGPSETEVAERVAAFLRRTHEQARVGDGNAGLAAEFVDHFLTGNAIFTGPMADALAQELLPTITTADVQAYGRRRAADSGRVVVVAPMADDPVAAMPPAALAARAAAVPARAVAQAAAGAAAADVDVLLDLDARPTAGTIASERHVAEARAYEWMLSNGMRVLLEPTSYAFDEIRFRAVAPGGASLAPDEAYASAYLADVIIGETGVGQVPAPRLRRWLEGSSISLAPSVSNDGIALEGGTAPDDLEAFFRLAHLYLTAPRRDTVAFRRYRERMASLAADRGRDPDVVFRDSLAVVVDSGNPRTLRHEARFYRAARLDDALAFWRARTANGANFTVAITGDFTLARMRPLVERYLASIPAGAVERPRGLGVPIVTGPARRELRGGIEQRARTAIAATGALEMTNENINALSALREVVARALSDRLREQMGGTYYVDVGLAIDVVPPARWTMTLDFESTPTRIDALADAAVEELARLRREGPTQAQFEGVREALVRDYDGRVESNGYWVDELTFHARHGWPLAGIFEHGQQAEALTREALARACATFLPERDYRRVTMRPPPSRTR